MSEPSPGQGQNRLAHETSPYLLQHADNPVDWYPWGPEALGRAKAEDRPILLSVGYSACHWCHVMERESFTDEATARLMNQHFVCIKVDREERPDLDEIYMAATIAMTGSGGWPMTVFLTPDQEPFFAGTYFPPTDVPGRPGFPNLLKRIAELWRSDRGKLQRQAAQLTESVRERARATAPMTVGQDAIDQAVEKLRATFDEHHGGFGPAPKFPQPLSLELLLRHHRRTGDERALEMVTVTLEAMARGGMRDHLGGGFARYSTDARWLVPHFEKMLYDNASLARVYAEAFQVTGNEDYRRVVAETASWVMREMQAPDGGFHSATDADSEGEEGKYFVWTREEIEAALPADQSAAFCAYYDVRAGGNWEGKSILHTPRGPREVAEQLHCSVAELEQRLTSARAALLAVRSQRVPPLLDDKILTSWNGLMIGALAECGRILDEPTYVAAAANAADFIWRALRRDDGGLWRSYRAGRAHLDGVLEDYAYLCDALLDLYEASGQPRFLTRAGELGDRLVAEFRDERDGGFFATSKDHEPLLVRYREGQDGALPNPNASAARALARLAALRDDETLRHHAMEAVSAYGRLIERAPAAFAGALRVVDQLLEGPVEIVLVGAGDAPGTKSLRRELGRHYLPNRIIVHVDPDRPDEQVAAALRQGRALVDGKSAAYVCRDFACRAPVTEPGELSAALGSDRNAAQAARQISLGRTGTAGAATAQGTAQRAERAGAAVAATGYVELGRTGLRASRVGFGGYRIDERAPGHDEALRRALRGGCNLIDTSTNYTDGDSERLVGRVLRELSAAGELSRDEIIVVSKIGYVQGANLDLARTRQERGEPYDQMVKFADDCWHCIHPSFLADQLSRSLDRLGLETLDVCLLHNPEYFLSDAERRGATDIAALRERFYDRVEGAFAYFEQQVKEGRIRHYGVSSNSMAAPSHSVEATDPARFWAAAERVAGAGHHFSVIQLPVNLLESRALLEPTVPGDGGAAARTVLAYARERKLAVLANRPLNAFGAEGLIRLAAPPPATATAPGGFAQRLEQLGELEQRFATRFGSRLQRRGGRPVGALLDWARQLGAVDGKLDSTEQVAQIAYGQVLPRTTRVLVAVEASLDGEAAAEFSAWQHGYLASLEQCFDALRAQAVDRMAERAGQLSAQLDPHVPVERRGESLQRKALWLLTSTPGLDVVLLGMRRPAYVDDGLAVMGWSPAGDVTAAFRAMGTAR